MSSSQESWLNVNNRTISVRPEDSNPPYVFIGSGTTRKVKGLSAEYLEAIAQKLKIKISYKDSASLYEIVRETKDGSSDIVLSLSYFNNKKVAVGKGYPVEKYIQTNYSKVLLLPVENDEVALQKLLLGEVDAAVMDLASLYYYTSRDVLSYVKAVGRTGFEYKHSFAVQKSMPELLLILDEGLKNLSDAEKQVIIDKWIQIDTVDVNTNPKTDTNDNHLFLWLIFAGFIVLIVATVVTVIVLKKTQIKMLFSRGLKKESINEVKDELEKLQKVRESRKEEMEHVEELEKDIESKINKI